MSEIAITPRKGDVPAHRGQISRAFRRHGYETPDQLEAAWREFEDEYGSHPTYPLRIVIEWLGY